MRKTLLVILAVVFAFGLAIQAQARDYYVLSPSAAGHADAQKTYGGKAYYDGKPYLYGSISDAYSNCVTGTYDTIHVLKGHVESVATPLVLGKTGVTVVGEGDGADRPLIGSYSTTGAGAAISMSANYCTVKNLVFSQPRADNAQAAIAVVGTYAAPVFGNVIDGVKINGAQYGANVSLADVITLGYAVNTKIINSEIDALGGGTSNCPDSVIDVQRAVTNTYIGNNKIASIVGTAGIQDDAAAGALSSFCLVDNVIMVTGTSKPAILLNNVQGSTPSGLIAGNAIAETVRSTIIAGITTTANKANRGLATKQGYDTVVK